MSDYRYAHLIIAAHPQDAAEELFLALIDHFELTDHDTTGEWHSYSITNAGAFFAELVEAAGGTGLVAKLRTEEHQGEPGLLIASDGDLIFTGACDRAGNVLATATEIEDILTAHPEKERRALADRVFGTSVLAAFEQARGES